MKFIFINIIKIIYKIIYIVHLYINIYNKIKYHLKSFLFHISCYSFSSSSCSLRLLDHRLRVSKIVLDFYLFCPTFTQMVANSRSWLDSLCLTTNSLCTVSLFRIMIRYFIFFILIAYAISLIQGWQKYTNPISVTKLKDIFLMDQI